MNINKKLIKGTAITAATVTVIAATGFHMVNAADVTKLGIDTGRVVQVADTSTTTTTGDVDRTAFKDETVYVIADATGSTKKVIVSDWLKNVNASSGLSDLSTLTDLVNVKGDETFETQSNNGVVWNANGNDIYYQGTTDAALPVTVKVTYSLDGVEMKPEELVGKSGKLTVRYDYSNQLKESVTINGTKEDIYTPLLMVTGMILSTDNYKNVEVTNGKIISDGNNQVVVGISLPGLSDSLKVDSDKLSIPDYFEYTADVTDYAVGTSVSLGLTDILSDVDLDGEDLNLDDIQDKIDELVDGVDQLVDGSTQLYDATGTLSDGTNKLYDATTQLDDAAGKLYGGSTQLYDGLTTLLSKSGDYKAAVETLSSSLTTLKEAVSQLPSGAKALDDGAAALVDGATTLHDGLGTAKDGMDQIVSNYSTVEAGVDQLTAGVEGAAAGLETLTGGLETANATYDTLSETVANDEAIIAALKQVNASYKDETIAALITKLEANTAGQKTIADGLTTAGDQLLAGAQSLSTGTAQLQAGLASLSQGIGALSQGSASVQSGLVKLFVGSESLLDGAKQLNAGTTSLVSNADQLATAGSQLATGGSSLLTATNQITTAIGDLQSGSGELNTNLGSLSEATGTLNENVATLNDGAGSIHDGAGELKDGIVKLQEEGIRQIQDLASGDLQNIVERFKAVVDQSKSYKNYSGIGDTMDGSVKFIIKYEDSSEQ